MLYRLRVRLLLDPLFGFCYRSKPPSALLEHLLGQAVIAALLFGEVLLDECLFLFLINLLVNLLLQARIARIS